MARRLAGLIPPAAGEGTILELGCGTGHLTRELLRRFPDARFVVTDLASGMLGLCGEHLGEIDRARVRLEKLDARAPELPETFDLLASSAEVGEPLDHRAHLAACRRLLREGGVYALSGFCRTNFPELDSILSSPPWDWPDPPGHFLSDARGTAERCGFEVQLAEEDLVEYVYPSAMEFLRAIGQSGASRAPRAGRPLTRELLRALVGAYDKRFSVAGGVKATWHPWFMVLRAA
jgi:malonyl-CoA O-methyltransferase